ncbi:hypothetical protein D3C87_954040 [compost metagenome]
MQGRSPLNKLCFVLLGTQIVAGLWVNIPFYSISIDIYCVNAHKLIVVDRNFNNFGINLSQTSNGLRKIQRIYIFYSIGWYFFIDGVNGQNYSRDR